MYEEYDYNWKSAIEALFTSLIGLGLGIVFLYFKKGQFTLAMGGIFFILCLFYVLRQMFYLTRITFSEFDVNISYFMPVRRGQRFCFDEVQSYQEVKIRDKAFMGFIELKEGERIMLTRSGIQNFDELTELLSDKFPVVCNQDDDKEKIISEN